MKVHVLHTRMQIPKIRERMIERESLLQKMKKNKEKKLIVLEAGAASGKTSLVSQYLTLEHLQTQTKWLSLGTECNNPFVFWGYVFEGLKSDLGDFSEEWLNFFHEGDKQEQLQEFLYFLCNQLSEVEEQFLVFDDFHLIQEPTIVESFHFFLENSPENMHVIIMTRDLDGLYLSSFEMANQLLYIRERDFRLSEAEASTFLQQTLQLSLGEVEMRQIVQYGNGWIGGLQMLASSRNEHSQRMERLVKNSRLLTEYLSQEIFNGLSESTQEFLVNTSPASYLCETISQQVFSDRNFHDVIEELERKNVMIQCLNEEEEMYQYHPILREFLLEKFHELDSNIRINIQEKIASGFILLEDLKEALYLFVRAKNYTKVMELVVANSNLIPNLYYIECVPIEAAIENIDFCYQKIFYHYSNLEYEVCSELIDRLTERYSDLDEVTALSGLKSLLHIGKDYQEKLIKFSAIEKYRMNDVSKGFLFVKNASTLYYQEQYRKAISSIQKGRAYNETAKNIFLSYFSSTLLAQSYEELGELSLALYYLEEANKILVPSMFSDKMKENYLINYQITITGILLKQLDRDNAKQALDFISEKIDSTMEVAYLYNYAEYLYLSDRPDEGYSLFLRLQDEYQKDETIPIEGLLKYALVANQLKEDTKMQWLQYYKTTSNLGINSQLIFSMFLEKQNKNIEAEKYIDTVLYHSKKNRNFLKIVEGNLVKLRILIKQSVRSLQEIQACYIECIHYASEYQIVAPFFLNQEVIQKLEDFCDRSFIHQLSEKEEAFYKNSIKCFVESPEGRHLTERENEVLREMAKGKTNKEIAASLFISTATVKTHILNIYRKFEVKSRVAAVEKGKKIGEM